MLFAGAESISEIPTDKWTFVALVFTNHTTNDVNSDTVVQDALPSAVKVTSPDDDIAAVEVTKQAALLDRAAAKERIKSQKQNNEYSIAIYFDGKLDAKMDFSDVVIANNYSAHFFNDVSFVGKSIIIFFFSFQIFHCNKTSSLFAQAPRLCSLTSLSGMVHCPPKK